MIHPKLSVPVASLVLSSILVSGCGQVDDSVEGLEPSASSLLGPGTIESIMVEDHDNGDDPKRVSTIQNLHFTANRRLSDAQWSIDNGGSAILYLSRVRYSMVCASGAVNVDRDGMALFPGKLIKTLQCADGSNPSQVIGYFWGVQSNTPDDVYDWSSSDNAKFASLWDKNLTDGTVKIFVKGGELRANAKQDNSFSGSFQNRTSSSVSVSLIGYQYCLVNGELSQTITKSVSGSVAGGQKLSLQTAACPSGSTSGGGKIVGDIT